MAEGSAPPALASETVQPDVMDSELAALDTPLPRPRWSTEVLVLTYIMRLFYHSHYPARKLVKEYTELLIRKERAQWAAHRGHKVTTRWTAENYYNAILRNAWRLRAMPELLTQYPSEEKVKKFLRDRPQREPWCGLQYSERRQATLKFERYRKDNLAVMPRCKDCTYTCYCSE